MEVHRELVATKKCMGHQLVEAVWLESAAELLVILLEYQITMLRKLQELKMVLEKIIVNLGEVLVEVVGTEVEKQGHTLLEPSKQEEAEADTLTTLSMPTLLLVMTICTTELSQLLVVAPLLATMIMGMQEFIE